MLKAECILQAAPPDHRRMLMHIVNQVKARAGLTPLANVTLAQLFDERRRICG